MENLTIKERIANMATTNADLCIDFYDKVINCPKPLMTIRDNDFHSLLEGKGNIALFHASDTSGSADRMDRMINDIMAQYRQLGCTIDKALFFLFCPEEKPLTVGEKGNYIFLSYSITNKDTLIKFGSGYIPGNATHIGILVKYQG